jgi:acyl-CoA thioesterase-1
MRGRARLAAALVVSALGCGERGPLVAFLGDSFTSGWRLPESDAYPAQLQRALREAGREIRVLNAGVDGETAAEALVRLPEVLGHRPEILVVALGINDGLRGLPPEQTEAALRGILERSRAAGSRLLLVGMRIPPQHGEDHARRFNEIYPRLAADYGTAFVDFLLEGVAGRSELLFPDGLHPNALGQRRLGETVRPPLEALLDALAAEAR